MTFRKVADPDSLLDWEFDFKGLTNAAEGAISDWLQAGETIDTFVITATGCDVADGVTAVDTVTPPVAAKAKSDTTVVVWAYNITEAATINCKIRTTPNGRIDERTVTFVMRDR